MKNARSALYPVRAKWRNFGIELEIDMGTLDSIERSFHFDHTECLTRMLDYWLKQTDPPPSWDAIVEALESGPVGEGHLAEQLKLKYCTSLDQKERIQSGKLQCTPPTCALVVDDSQKSSLAAACTIEYFKYLKALYTSSKLPSDNKWPPTPSKCYINLAFIDKQKVTRHEADEFTRYTIKGNIDDICHKKAPITIEKVACMQEIPFAYDPSQLEVSYPKLVLVTGAPGVGKSTFAWELCRRWGSGELLQHFSLVILLRLRDKNVREANELTDILFYRKKSISESLAIEIEQSNGEGVLFILEGYDELPESLRVESSLYLDLIYGRLLPLATVLVTSRPWAVSNLHWKATERISQQFEILGFTKQQIDEYLISITLGDSHLLDELRRYMYLNPPIHAAMYIPLNAAIVFVVYKDRRGRTDCIIPNTMTELYTAFSLTLLIRYVGDQGEKIRKVSCFEDLPKGIYKKFLDICKIASDGIRNGEQLIFSDLPDDFETLGFMQSVPELHFSGGVSVSYNFLHLTIQEFLAAYHLSLQQDEVQIKYQKGSVARFLAGITKLNNSAILRHLPRSSPLVDKIPLHLTDSSIYMHISVDFREQIHHKNTNLAHNTVAEGHIDLNGGKRLLSGEYEWFYEGQNKVLLQECIGTKTAFLMITRNMSPMDCFVAGWCVGNSGCKWKLCFNEEDGTISLESMEMLHAGIKQCIHQSASNEVCELYIICGSNLESESAALIAFFDLQNIITFNVKRLACLSQYYEDVANSYISIMCSGIEKYLHLEEVILDCGCPSIQGNNLLNTTFASRSVKKLKLGNKLSECFINMGHTLFNPNLDSLSLYFSSEYNVESDEASVKRLTTSFISCKSLKELTIRDYPFYVHGMLLSQINRALVNGPEDVCKKYRCTNSGEIIAYLLKETTTLETLALQDCGLGQCDTTLITEAVKHNKTLIFLDISDNNCSRSQDAEVDPFADMLRVNQTLRVLRLCGSNIDTNSLFKILANNENTTLMTLDVRDNVYSVKNLADMLRNNRSLQCLLITVTIEYKDRPTSSSKSSISDLYIDMLYSQEETASLVESIDSESHHSQEETASLVAESIDSESYNLQEETALVAESIDSESLYLQEETASPVAMNVDSEPHHLQEETAEETSLVAESIVSEPLNSQEEIASESSESSKEMVAHYPPIDCVVDKSTFRLICSTLVTALTRNTTLHNLTIHTTYDHSRNDLVCILQRHQGYDKVKKRILITLDR